ncbi:MAG: glutamyl-tRNA reductase [Solirubrobacteraceae bacterium]
MPAIRTPSSACVAVAGISWREASPAMRDRLHLARSDAAALIDSCAAECREQVLLSTCNRVEGYASGVDAEDAERAARQLLEMVVGHVAVRRTYSYTNRWAAHHLFRVVAGLESQSVGEPHIVGQVRCAYQQARSASSTGPLLSRLFESAAAASKRIRSRTSIGTATRPLPKTLFDLTEELAGQLRALRVLVIGAGQIARAVAEEARSRDCLSLTIANRTLSGAARLASMSAGRPVGLSSLPEALLAADVVIAATASRVPVVTAASLPARTPAVVFDLGVPHNVASIVGRMTHVVNLDELASRSAAPASVLQQADAIARHEADRFDAWLAGRSLHSHALASLRESPDAIRLLRRGPATKLADRKSAPSAPDQRC